MSKGIAVKCTNIKLRTDGKQQVILEKPASNPTTSEPGSPAKTVYDPDLYCSYTAEPNEPFSVGRDYTITIS
jgi:hypothetical protein